MVVEYNTTSLIWRGLYEFTQTAAKEIEEQYRALPNIGDAIKLQFDPITNSFILTGPRDTADVAYQAFARHISTQVEKYFASPELRKDPFVVPGKATRSFVTRLNCGNPIWTDEHLEEEQSEDEEIGQLLREIGEKVTESEFTEYQKWAPRYRETLRECFFPDGEDLMAHLGKKLNAVLHMDWINGDVKIGAHSLDSLEEIKQRLSTAENYFHTPFKRKKAHLINSGEMERFEIHLVPISRQASTIGKTTLFPPDHKYSSVTGRSKLSSARLSDYSPKNENFINVAFQCNETYNARDQYNAGIIKAEIWKNFTYEPKGSQIPPVPVKPKPVDQETTSVGDSDIIIPNTRPNVAGEPKPAAPIIRPSVLSVQKDESGNLQFGARPQETDTGEIEETEDLPSMAPKRKVRAPRGGFKPPPPPKAPVAPSVSTFTYGGSYTTSEAEDSSTPLGPRPAAKQVESGYSDSGSSSGTVLPTSRPVLQQDEEMVPAAARRPRARPRKAPASDSDKATSEGTSEDLQSERSNDTLTYGPGSTTSGQRTPRPLPEYKTRNFRDTQRQRAPRHKQVFNNLPDMKRLQRRTFDDVFGEAFEDVRRFRGDVKFEARLGRIVFPDVPKKYAKSTYAFQWNNWDSELERIGIETVFTDRMSIAPCDIDFVSEIKVSGGDSLFENPPGIKKITYEIECQTLQGVSFLIHVNASTFNYTIKGPEERLGTVVWNCPTHSWDAEFSLNAYHIVRSVSSQAQALVDAMSIEKGLEYPLIWINKANLDIKILRATCLRESRHMVLPSEIHHGHEFTLVLTEHINLKVQENPRFPDIVRLAGIEGIESNELNMTWYTMSIMADMLDLGFSDNRYLMIGDLTPAETKKGFLGRTKEDGMSTLDAMVEVVSKVISKIDNVGFWNAQKSDYDEMDD